MDRNTRAKRVLEAGCIYFAVVFGVGFLLGPVRVIWLEPELGKTVAVLCEAPFLLLAMILGARWVPGWVQMPPGVGPLIGMGLLALVLQQAADFAFGLLRGVRPAAQFAEFATPAGIVYGTLLVVFAAMPVLVARR
jgi:hypothetical protein